MQRGLLGFGLGVLALLLVCEGALRLLPVSGATRVGTYIDPRIPTYQPGLRIHYATGWDLRNPQPLITNAMGFVADRDFKPDPSAVALIGDSFVEAASLDLADRPAQQLEKALGGRRPVYAMGTAGSSLLDYAERVRFARDKLGIRDFVLLMERGDFRQALCGSGNVASQCLDPSTLAPRTELAPPASTFKQLLRKSALARYAVSQLKIDPKRLLNALFARDVPHEAAPAVASRSGPPPMPQAAFDAVTTAFFERVKPYADARLVILLDADRPALAQGQRPQDPQRQAFINRARAAGLRVVDAQPLFSKHFERSTLSLDVGPYDGHLNVLGYRLLVDAASRELQP